MVIEQSEAAQKIVRICLWQHNPVTQRLSMILFSLTFCVFQHIGKAMVGTLKKYGHLNSVSMITKIFSNYLVIVYTNCTCSQSGSILYTYSYQAVWAAPLLEMPGGRSLDIAVRPKSTQESRYIIRSPKDRTDCFQTVFVETLQVTAGNPKRFNDFAHSLELIH